MRMRQMGNSGKVATISGIVAVGLLVLTGMTLSEPVFVTLLGVLALACLAALFEVLHRRRYVMLAVAGLATTLAVAGSLAFLSTWELAFAGQASLFGTPLPTKDPDDYFFLAALSLLIALGALFAGALLPGIPGRSRQVIARASTGGRIYPVRRSPGQGRQGAKEGPARQGAKQGQVAKPRQGGKQRPARQVAKQDAARQSARQTPARQSAGKPPGRWPRS